VVARLRGTSASHAKSYRRRRKLLARMWRREDPDYETARYGGSERFRWEREVGAPPL
jgi:hypothetical protein